jgi:hypothetical protein
VEPARKRQFSSGIDSSMVEGAQKRFRGSATTSVT